ncbi:MAG: hypothetical protein NZ957_02895 [Thaumarchaeota archaeon]|nr:hypothetical protein [Candidatus Calditenuaceae archaeon]MDW8042229.1 hypothetical protein [Nitrososphaerota archaeon]
MEVFAGGGSGIERTVTMTEYRERLVTNYITGAGGGVQTVVRTTTEVRVTTEVVQVVRTVVTTEVQKN